jgi:hypothetical protein
MCRIKFSFLSGLLLMSSFPLAANADGWAGYRQDYQSESIGKQAYERKGNQELALTTLYEYPNNPVSYDSSYGYPIGSYYGSYYSTYPSYSYYSAYPVYSNPYANSYYVNPYYQYVNPYYGSYYYNPGMYNPNTTFVNPPSSLNYPTGYPGYSETYIYR